MRFTKMQGLGNDYLYVYGEVPADAAALSKRLSDRHFGVGADGMIYIGKSSVADFSMRIFNSDGSEGMMCGNGIRCVGKYVYEKGYTDKTDFSVETLSGVRNLKLSLRDGKVFAVSVDMGSTTVSPMVPISVCGMEFSPVPVSVGNEHVVIFTDNAESVPLSFIGPKIEKHEAFSGSVNVEFAEILGEGRIRMRVWERGSGITLACGTGACAVTAAAAYLGFVNHNSSVTVILDGGELQISTDDENRITMTGGAEFVFEGEEI